ncbi:hypothetical protein HanRHA438_Chr06g0249291 [Helianthus annuus]|nr:hypothetical protein HanIR_Chr00c28g0911611 [Helianthus annuus]KAJ0910162.1 hypothetical protein HanRHA438_Chr06g0249291 [Helianthus annuus]
MHLANPVLYFTNIYTILIIRRISLPILINRKGQQPYNLVSYVLVFFTGG